MAVLRKKTTGKKTTRKTTARKKTTSRKQATSRKKTTRKYGPKAAEKVERAMHEMHEGTLKSGGSGKPVTSRDQAVAIGLEEARKSGAKVPRAKKS
ncbi:MAG TPA: DUF6496 domain-containing protein [Candidatus Dormibacteraeota bacterium]|nr:DUF6496 domain-containing protein [Candidatus Dormibacteraeota bacterium]